MLFVFIFIAAIVGGLGVGFFMPVLAHIGIDKAVEKRAIKGAEGKSTRPLPQLPPANDPTMCAMYEVRMTQQKMVDAGILEQWELSNCDNEECNNCYTGSIVAATRRPKFVQQREIIPQASPSRQKRVVRGEEIFVPDGVPEYAHSSIGPNKYDGTSFEILWSWTDPETGKPYFMKSLHPRKESFQAGYKPAFSRPNVRSNKAIERIRQDKKELKRMLDETKRQTEAYHKAQKGFCECTEEIIESVDGKLSHLVFKTCEYHNAKAVKKALANSKVRKSTDSTGPR